MTFSEEYLEAISLLPADDPVRIEFEGALTGAPKEVRGQYAALVSEAAGLREQLEVGIPSGLMEGLETIPGRLGRRRHRQVH